VSINRLTRSANQVHAVASQKGVNSEEPLSQSAVFA